MTARTAAKHNQNAKRSTQSKLLFKGTDLVFLILAVVGSLHVMSMISIETHRILLNGSGVSAMTLEIEKVSADIQHFTDITNNTNPIFMEQLARCQGYIFPNEVRIATPLTETEMQALECRILK